MDPFRQTYVPSDQPRYLPSDVPSDIPSDVPSDQPRYLPSDVPSDIPSTSLVRMRVLSFFSEMNTTLNTALPALPSRSSTNAILYKSKLPTDCQTQKNMTSKPALLSSLVSTVLVVAGFLVLFERTDIGTSLIEQSSMYFHHEQAKKGVFGFIRKNSDVDSSMHLSDGLYIDTATAKASVKYIAALLTFAICLIAHFAYLTLSAIWPVSFKNIYHIYHGVPGSILELLYSSSQLPYFVFGDL